MLGEWIKTEREGTSFTSHRIRHFEKKLPHLIKEKCMPLPVQKNVKSKAPNFLNA